MDASRIPHPASRITDYRSDMELWSRLILFRPRAEFRLPAGWAERDWIPLGELRPLLQAVSPVRDLSDIWRWVAEPVPVAEVEAELTTVPQAAAWVGVGQPAAEAGRAIRVWDLQVGGQLLRATLTLEASGSAVERLDLAEVETSWFQLPAPEARAAMLAVAAALRRACGCVTVGL